MKRKSTTGKYTPRINGFSKKTEISVSAPVSKTHTSIDYSNGNEPVLSDAELFRTLQRVKNGDFTVRLPSDLVGIKGKICDTLNDIIEMNERMVYEFEKVGNSIGKQGKLTKRVELEGARGSWESCVDSVNTLISDLVHPTIEIANVITSVAKGNLSQDMPLEIEGHPLQGEFLRIAKEVNGMVKQLNLFSMEVTRVAREVGTDGKLGGQATVKGVGGVWKDLTDSVNQMASNLTGQVRNIADVTTAVAKGDLSKKITVDVKGEIQELKNTINTMVDQLNSFASEVTRVSREVGTEGKLGGQAQVKGVAGTWKDLTDSVNQMASNLTGQVRNIAEVTTAVAKGDLSKKITVDVRGEILELKNTINTMVDQLNSFGSEVTRVAREVGSEGKLGGQAKVRGVGGVWEDLTDSVNQMASNLTAQVRNIAEVTTAVAKGDLSKKITVDVEGEILELKITINTMVDQLNSFGAEVTRVAREVGSEGKLGGQAKVKGVGGTWKDLTDSVNQMASNLTNQVRNIAEVTTAVAKGDLSKKITVKVEGEILELKKTINTMVDQLNSFSSEVTRVAREVGAEGKLGGQASVPGTSGTWKNLTENVNQLAANLTTQVRAISEVASAVTKGDLTRSIGVEAKGEVEALKDTINQMIANLKATTLRNQEQDWLKSNLAKFTQMLQGQKELNSVTKRILSELAQVVSAQQGLFYIMEPNEVLLNSKLKLIAAYAFRKRKSVSNEFMMGEGLVGQCAVEKERILLTDVPSDYIQIGSGLGEAKPMNIIVLPVLFEGDLKAVIELASFDSFSKTHLDFLEGLTESIGIVLNTIETNSRTESLLAQSQSLAEELKSQQEVLRKTNEQLQEKAFLLANQKEEVEIKNQEVEVARKSLEEKAAQLTLTSKYKSEFLANMSHELRTPLNSLQILSKELIENPEKNLTAHQVQFAKTIHSCGEDLIQLINDILDLSKIESGYISVDVLPVRFQDIINFVERTFRHVSEAKRLKFAIEIDNKLPEFLETDAQRLNQILKNLLSNSFKFTERGEVKLKIYMAVKNLNIANEGSMQTARVAFEISDTGIGISKDKQNIIFEAFQQAEGSTSRKYGGTGLGLSISRGLSDLLGGSIELLSEPNAGSTFTLFLPMEHPQNSREQFIVRNASGEVAPDINAVHAISSAGTSNAVFFKLNETEDDRNTIQTGDKILLVFLHDLNLTKTILKKAHENDMKALIASGASEVIDFVNHFHPDAIAVDADMPEMNGWKVFDRLKSDLKFRHIPVYILSCYEEDRNIGLQRGAKNVFLKPLADEDFKILFDNIRQFSKRKVKNLLLVKNHGEDAIALEKMFEGGDVNVCNVSSGEEAVRMIRETPPDCLIIDSVEPGMIDHEIISELENAVHLNPTPVIVYSEKIPRNREADELKSFAKSFIHKKDDGQSLACLTAQAAFFLHRPLHCLPDETKQVIENYHNGENIFEGKKVLIVDDDMRNLFALTTALERFKINVLNAESGQEAIAVLQHSTDIDIVLMDIMMPEMDGYETMKCIRNLEKNKDITIIALTAKAMKGDREKCIESGASDYITKPVNLDQLLSVMSVWLKYGVRNKVSVPIAVGIKFKVSG